MKNIFIFLLSFFMLIGCRDNENNDIVDVEINPSKVNLRFSDFSNALLGAYITLEYDAENLIRKNGGYLSMSGGTGYNGFFTMDIYTILNRKDNIIEITDHSSNPQLNPNINKKKFIVDNQNNIISKYIYTNPTYPSSDRLLTYKYDNGKVVEIITSYPNEYVDPNNPIIFTYSETFQYNSDGNLNRSYKVLKFNGIIDNDWDKTEIIFDQFDNSKNPFKALKFLDDFFYRSLSRNNYKHYKKTVYRQNIITSVSEFTQEFNYDSSGSLILE